MANIAVIGASGRAGSRITKELISRGHTVTGIATHPEKIERQPGVTPVAGDVNDKDGLAKILKGHDAVISAVRFVDTNPKTLIAAVRESGVKRYLVVGGAGSLEVAPGQMVIDQPGFPESFREEASGGLEFLNALKETDDLDWSFLSPSANFFIGERTGKFRLGKDQLLTNEEGSSISFEDFAVAMVDELENNQHLRQRFTVGY